MRRIAVVGLGYVGLPLAVAFAEAGEEVVGYDRDRRRVDAYRRGEDPTESVGDERLRRAGLTLSADEEILRDCSFYIVAVPTPLGRNNSPDLGALESASRSVGTFLRPGAIVVYESTVYPGVTEDVCVPLLSGASGLTCPGQFRVGYSPERINPGDRVHTLATVTKIVSGVDAESTAAIAELYGRIVPAGIYRAPSIKVAEAAKVIENAQRDVNIAFMNELAMIFERIGIRTRDVLDAAGTKWNFQRFRPGLVGGHCIGVDPYYLAYRSEELGHLSQLILAGRRINESMSAFIAEKSVKMLISSGRPLLGSRVLVLGATFKENVRDARNSKVFDLVRRLEEFSVRCDLVDPHADPEDVRAEHHRSVTPGVQGSGYDGVIVAVAHDSFRSMPLAQVRSWCSGPEHGRPILVDVKGLFEPSDAASLFDYWTP